MYTDEQFEELEQQELDLTNEVIAAMVVLLLSAKSDLVKELRVFYSEYGKDGVVTYSEARKWVSKKDTRRRMTVLNLMINDTFTKTLNKLEPEFRNMMLEIVKYETEFFDSELSEEDIEKLLSKKWGVDDNNWEGRLTDDVALWTAYILNEVKQGFLKGVTLDTLLQQIDKRFKSMINLIKALGLTESSAIGSLSRHEIFKILGVTKYRYYTKVDERRCDECGALHGIVFPISAYEVGVTASPIHTRCRCWEVPIL